MIEIYCKVFRIMCVVSIYILIINSLSQETDYKLLCVNFINIS